MEDGHITNRYECGFFLPWSVIRNTSHMEMKPTSYHHTLMQELEGFATSRRTTRGTFVGLPRKGTMSPYFVRFFINKAIFHARV
jgi:hypothetical protein